MKILYLMREIPPNVSTNQLQQKFHIFFQNFHPVLHHIFSLILSFFATIELRRMTIYACLYYYNEYHQVNCRQLSSGNTF